ncbi:twin-arginine translocase subunit TatC [Flexivirga caeni]|uniref:Sec-independent protein translocase protein TatC n=2 Tax=Flexivirga caeni TaxID=2294115 RepID=A0A3M9MHC2_9MICO|nr:twin-arginine translocase subunit TatC [Flexivirga caeni]
MSLGDHFREFRRRALISAIAIVIGACIAWAYYNTIYGWVEEPLRAVQQRHHRSVVGLNFGNGGVSEPFTIKLKISLWSGALLACPIWLWQIWAFLAPGLTKKEKRVSLLFVSAAVPLFALGCYVSHFAITNAVDFLMGSTPEVKGNEPYNLTDAQKYVSFVIKFVVAFGFAFLLPVFLVGLNQIRVFPGRVMLKGWRVAVMVIGVFSAVMSPAPDAWSMLALMVPMIILYFAACVMCLFLDKRRATREDKERTGWLDVPDDEKSEL